MNQLTFSMMEGPRLLQQLERALYNLALEEGFMVAIQEIPWISGRSQLMDIALFKGGTDVSEIGTTWMSSMERTKALRPFSEDELAVVGGKSAFFSSSWSTVDFDGQIWGVPWTSDTRLIFYRRDLLEKAGIDEVTAFADADAIAQTLLALKESGIDIPISIPNSAIFHAIAFWVWSNGGDFMSEDGRHPLFTEPEALAGIYQFYQSLAPVLPRENLLMRQYNGEDLFMMGHSAATIAGYQLLHNIMLENNSIHRVKENLGVAAFPGPHFHGGSNLVVWTHGQNPEQSLKLVEFLTRADIYQKYFLQAGWLPAKPDGFPETPLISAEFDAIVKDSLATGRPFNAVYRWGTVEDRLTDCFNQMWRNISAKPNADIEEVVDRQIMPVAKKLEIMLRT